MTLRASILAAVFAASAAAGSPALACGDSEAGLACDATGAGPEQSARYMLTRVEAALKADKPGALDKFTQGTGGFRTANTYVFCIGPDGMMNAHFDPTLRGRDVRDLHDATGNYFIKTMMENAKAGQISVVRYLFPKPGTTVPVPKTTYYTRTDDQVCAVGVYVGDDGRAPSASASPQERIAALRRKLDGQIPEAARKDWTALLEALDAQANAQDASIAKARDGLRAAETVLTKDEKVGPATE